MNKSESLCSPEVKAGSCVEERTITLCRRAANSCSKKIFSATIWSKGLYLILQSFHFMAGLVSEQWQPSTHCKNKWITFIEQQVFFINDLITFVFFFLLFSASGMRVWWSRSVVISCSKCRKQFFFPWDFQWSRTDPVFGAVVALGQVRKCLVPWAAVYTLRQT